MGLQCTLDAELMGFGNGLDGGGKGEAKKAPNMVAKSLVSEKGQIDGNAASRNGET
jgi:hypothetical protein